MTGPRPFAGWSVVALGSYIHNCSYGAAFGTFGVSLVAIQERFGVSRATGALAFSLVTAAVVLSAPVLGALYSRISIRRSMILGALLGAAGYACLAVTYDWRLMLLWYGLLVGPGVALAGSMPTSVLAMRWFAKRQGAALGIVNLPLGLTLAPLGAVAVLHAFGLTVLFLVTGALLLSVVIAAWPVIDDPAEAGQEPFGSVPQHAKALTRIDSSTLRTSEILGRWDFWILVAAVGVITGGATMKYAHMVPLIGEQGHSMQTASALLAMSGAAGALGSILFGILADRIGGATVLIATAVIQALMWLVFLVPVGVPVLAADALIIGMCGGGIPAAQGVFISHRFGAQNFSRVLGLLALALLPFFVGINPLAGYLHDRTGSYRTSVVLLVGASIVASVLLLSATIDERRRRRSAVAAAALPESS